MDTEYDLLQIEYHRQTAQTNTHPPPPPTPTTITKFIPNDIPLFDGFIQRKLMSRHITQTLLLIKFVEWNSNIERVKSN